MTATRRGGAKAWILVLLPALVGAPPAPGGEEAGCPGLVAERDGGGALPDLKAGDELLAWRQLGEGGAEPPAGRLCSYFDWVRLRREEMDRPGAGVEISGRRGGEPIAFRPGPGRWPSRLRPGLPAPLLERYREGLSLFEAGRDLPALAAWGRLREGAAADLRVWITLLGGVRATSAEGRRQALAGVREELESAPPELAGDLWEAAGALHFQAGELAQARQALARALELRRGEPRPSPAYVAYASYQVGRVALERGDLDAAREAYGEALELYRRHYPGGLRLAETLNGLAQVRAEEGETRQAVALYREALSIFRRLEPRGEAIPGLLNNLGILTTWTGDLQTAEDYYGQALSALAGLPAGESLLSRVLTNLGDLAYRRSDYERAARHWERALALKERLAPGSTFSLSTLANLGDVALAQGDLATAERHFRRVQEIAGRLLPGTLQEAGALADLGYLEQSRGAYARAEAHYRAALDIQGRLAPGGRDAARSHWRLAEVKGAAGRVGEAFEHYRRSLEIYRQISPEGEEVASVLASRGDLEVRERRWVEAEESYRQAASTLEAQLRTLGGTADLRAGFRDLFRELYPRYVDLLLDLGRPQEALAVYERSRARALLEMLAERDLALAGLPAQLEEARRQVARRHDRVQRELLTLDAAAEPERAGRLRAELAEIRRQRDDLAAEARRAAPRPAGLYDPRPFDLAGIRESLDPGTLLLAYSVGPSRTNLFVVTREGGLRVERLPLGAAELEEGVRRWRALIAESAAAGSAYGGRRRASFEQLGRRLHASLIAPVAAEVEAARRVLLVPDGPLHLLPFAALPDAAAAGRPAYLIERRPLHYALSATLYAELRAGSRGAVGRAPSLLAFGDPELPAFLRRRAPAEIGDPVLRSLVEGGFSFPPLPAARQEVEGIAALFPGGRPFLGGEAREERVKALAAGATHLHFATHAVLDETSPLESALVLAVPEQLGEGENGLLQVWEVLEQLRLDADLVVLSGCETALGKRLSGEGLMGLTRAFHYAGARSVVASLWRVADTSTAELMTRLYRHLRQGMPHDEALRAAQVELLKGEAGARAAAPYSWAAFRLSGDWRGGAAGSGAPEPPRSASRLTGSGR